MAARKFTMTIHFNDNTRASFIFSGREENEYRNAMNQIDSGIKETRYLKIESEGDFFVIPFESIKYIQVTPSPRTLPSDAITGAKILS